MSKEKEKRREEKTVVRKREIVETISRERIHLEFMEREDGRLKSFSFNLEYLMNLLRKVSKRVGWSFATPG